MRATLSIKGLYDFDNTLFSEMSLPSGVALDDIISNLTVELAELEVIYPSVVTMKRAIGDWSKSRVKSWNKIVAALDADYNPIENYDRQESWTDGATSSGGYVNKVAGFNAAEMANQSSSDQETSSNSQHSGRVHGNIGVTMAQDMINAEIDMRVKFDIIHIIINEFKQRFCLMVY